MCPELILGIWVMEGEIWGVNQEESLLLLAFVSYSASNIGKKIARFHLLMFNRMYCHAHLSEVTHFQTEDRKKQFLFVFALDQLLR